MHKMDTDRVTQRCLEAGCGILLDAQRVRLPNGEEVLRRIPDFQEIVGDLTRELGLGYLWIVKPFDPADHPVAAPEDTRLGILVGGTDGAVRGFLRKAGQRLGCDYAIARWNESATIELFPTVKRGPSSLQVGPASAVPLIRVFGHMLKMTPPQDEITGGGEVPDLRELVVREPLGFFSGLSMEAARRRRRERAVD